MFSSDRFVADLASDREFIVPVLGAGLAIDAGMPSGSGLAEALAERTSIDLGTMDLEQVADQIARENSEAEMHKLVAEILTELPTHSTPVLELLARCPSQKLLTTNHDDAIELTVGKVGLQPVRLWPSDQTALCQPRAGQVHVIHMHGVLEEPDGLIVSKTDRQRALHDPYYAHLLRNLASAHRLLFLGFRFGANETPIRTQLDWVESLYRSENRHFVVVPAGLKRADLDQLAADGVIEVVTYENDPAHRSVAKVAQILAPQARSASEPLAAQVNRERLSPYFTRPRLLRAGDDDDRQTSMIVAELYGGISKVEDLAEAQRALLVAPPGFGKSEVLQRCGVTAAAGRVIYAPLASLPGEIEANGDHGSALARLLVKHGRAFDDETDSPSLEALTDEGTSFTILLDGLDEVAVPRRAEVIETMLACAREWPQHRFVIASRPIAEVEELQAGGFTEFNLVESQAWGQEYLEKRGVEEAKVHELLKNVAAIGPLISIPQYAKDLGELLVSTGEVPETTVELVLGRQREAIAAQSPKAGNPVEDTYNWVRRLAVGMELRGQNSAPAAELADIPGEGHFSAEARRDLLVRSTLLRDLPGEAQFASGVVQEAFCAEAILGSDDPLATLREVAVAEIGGEESFRSDIEHTIDLVFEAADDGLRAELRKIDPIRWARTQRPQGHEDDIEAALETLRTFYREHRLWREWRLDNQLRGSARAIEVLNEAHPEIVAGWKEELIAETESEERTVRGNAIDLLRLPEPDDSTAEWLFPRVTDEDSVVRRIAAYAVGELKPEGWRDALAKAWEQENEELALDAIGAAILEATEDGDLIDALTLLAANKPGWRRIGFHVKQRLTPSLLPNLFALEALSVDEIFELVDGLLEEEDVDWSDDDVAALAEWVMSHVHDSYKLRRSERLADLCAQHPDAALAGAEAGVQSTEALHPFDIQWLLQIDTDRLEKAVADGTKLPLEQLGATRRAAQDPPPDPEPFESPEEPKSLEELLARGEIDADHIPDPSMLRGELKLSDEARKRLAELGEEWYPTDPIADAVTPPGGRRQINNGLLAALLAFSALDTEISKERWLELFAACAFSFGSETREWANKHFDPAWSADVADIVSGFEDQDSVGEALEVIGDWDDAIADAFAAKVGVVEDSFIGQRLAHRLGKAGHVDALTALLAATDNYEIVGAATLELAQLGDVKAQLELLRLLQEEVKANPGGYHHGRSEWFDAAADPELLPPSIELLRTAWEAEDAHLTMRAIAGMIEQIAGEEALRIYDELIADDSLRHGQFLWHNRMQFARELARREVLERLPQSRADLVAVVEPAAK